MEFDAEILAIKDETWDTKTFTLKQPSEINFISGQCCRIRFNNQLIKNVFITSLPSEKEYFRITLKKTSDKIKGLFNLKVGDKVIIEKVGGKGLPFNQDTIVIVGGSGITCVISAIKESILNRHEIYLFYSNRTRADIIFRSELNLLSYHNKNFHLINTITTNTCGGDIPECGRINESMIRKYVNDPGNYHFYISGPSSMMADMRRMLKVMKIKKEKMT